MTIRQLTQSTAICICLGVAASQAFATPPKVGSGNEAVIEPDVPHPDETPCRVTLVQDAKFTSGGATYSYTPPAACPGPWAKVVLQMDFSVTAGRQYDRSGLLFLDGIPLWFGTTAEPRATLSPKWSFQKDVTDYTAIFETSGSGSVSLYNLVNSEYTGIISLTATLLFYPPTAVAPAPVTADVVLPLPAGGGEATLDTGTDQMSTNAALPTNILHATLDLYLQGQSNDEFWYSCVPDALSSELESCGNAALREGEVTVDGAPAGVAPIYPWIFTGGDDPYFWQPIPGVQTFNFIPFHNDLSPFAGVLSNGATTHTIAVSVYNANSYFAATGALRLFLDKGATQVTGSVTKNTLAAAPKPTLVTNITDTNGLATGTVDIGDTRDFTISGTAIGSAGTTVNTLTQHSRFIDKQRFAVSSTKELQDTSLSTDITIVTASSTGGTTTTETKTLQYPFYLDTLDLTARNGSITQHGTVGQQYLSNDVVLMNGAVTSQDSLTNTITSSDELFITSSYSISGHNNQSETASYAHTSTGAPCFKRLLVSTFNVLTTVQTGC